MKLADSWTNYKLIFHELIVESQFLIQCTLYQECHLKAQFMKCQENLRIFFVLVIIVKLFVVLDLI